MNQNLEHEELSVYTPARFRRMWQVIEWRNVKAARRKRILKVALIVMAIAFSEGFFLFVYFKYGQ